MMITGGMIVGGGGCPVLSVFFLKRKKGRKKEGKKEEALKEK